jgi:hypothetical protein
LFALISDIDIYALELLKDEMMFWDALFVSFLVPEDSIEFRDYCLSNVSDPILSRSLLLYENDSTDF